MKAALLRSPGRVTVEDMPAPAAGPGELVVSMRACGLCGSDLEKIRGTYTAAPPVIGHEAVGAVAEVGEGVTGFRRGDRVFPHHHVPCGECETCRAGSPTMCPQYRATNLEPGGFAESFRVPRWNVERGGVLPLPQGMDWESASFIEPLACAVRSLDRCPPQPASALVLGAGPMGLLALQLLRLRGASWIGASEPSPVRRRVASRMGAARTWDPRSADIVAATKGGTRGRGADVAVVATGHVDAISDAVRAVRPGGTVCLLGVPEAGGRLAVDPSEFVTREVSLIPSNAATETETQEALTLIAAGRVDVASLVSHRFPLADLLEAVRTAEGGKCVKAVVLP